MRAIAAVLVLSSGCTLWFSGGDDAPTTVDAGIRPEYDSPRGPCGLVPPFSGKFVDLDQTPSNAMPIMGARIVSRSSGMSDTSDATGRFDVCYGNNGFVYDIDMPEPYADALAVHDYNALTDALYEPTMLRAWTPTRAMAFYAEHGLVYDPMKAHVMVFVAGDASDTSLDRTHDTAFAAQEGYMTPAVLEWMPGSVGRYVWYPNVDATESTGTFKGGFRDLSVPLVANKITFVVYSVVYVD